MRWSTAAPGLSALHAQTRMRSPNRTCARYTTPNAPSPSTSCSSMFVRGISRSMRAGMFDCTCCAKSFICFWFHRCRFLRTHTNATTQTSVHTHTTTTTTGTITAIELLDDDCTGPPTPSPAIATQENMPACTLSGTSSVPTEQGVMRTTRSVDVNSARVFSYRKLSGISPSVHCVGTVLDDIRMLLNSAPDESRNVRVRSPASLHVLLASITVRRMASGSAGDEKAAWPYASRRVTFMAGSDDPDVTVATVDRSDDSFEATPAKRSRSWVGGDVNVTLPSLNSVSRDPVEVKSRSDRSKVLWENTTGPDEANESSTSTAARRTSVVAEGGVDVE
eukprot:Opistho-2@93839